MVHSRPSLSTAKWQFRTEKCQFEIEKCQFSLTVYRGTGTTGAPVRVVRKDVEAHGRAVHQAHLSRTFLLSDTPLTPGLATAAQG